MTTMKELLGQGDIPKPKKNFLVENVRKLREMKLDKTNKLNLQRNKTSNAGNEKKKHGTWAGTGSRKHQLHSAESPTHDRRTATGRVRRESDTLHLQEPRNESPKGYRSQGCQTLTGKQLETLYHEGVIRYPSARPQDAMSSHYAGDNGRKEMALQTEPEVEVLHAPPSPSPSNFHPHPSDESGGHVHLWNRDEEKEDASQKGHKDFVRLNAAIPETQRLKTAEQNHHQSSGKKDPTRAPPTYQKGVIPKYLKEQKKELEKDRINKAKELADDCPEGHIELPHDIKQKHLTTLRENYRELVSQLNQLPVSTDSLRTRNRKKQIEAELDRIEAAIALFSRERVFVKADS